MFEGEVDESEKRVWVRTQTMSDLHESRHDGDGVLSTQRMLQRAGDRGHDDQ